MDLKQDVTLLHQGNVPAFLLKLWKIVEDRQYDRLISWSQDGRTFKVHDQMEFAKEILPKFYKHNNFSSFVRQVNMYGFRKIIDPGSGSLKPDKDDWEFRHQYFQQGQPGQLYLIKRKAHAKDDTKATTNNIVHLLQDVENLKNQHEVVENKLSLVKNENEMLWREIADLRERHQNQQTVINKLIQFFVQLVMSKGDMPTRKRRAIDYPMDTKFAKSQELQPYVPQSVNFAQLFQDPSYTVESPLSTFDDRVTELSPDLITVDNEGVGLPISTLSPPSSAKTVTVIPSTKPTITKTTKSPFIFPETFTQSSSGNDLTTMAVSMSCNKTEDNTPCDSVCKQIFPTADANILTDINLANRLITPSSLSPGILTTPTVSAPGIPETTQPKKRSQVLITPSVSVPVTAQKISSMPRTEPLSTPVLTVPHALSRQQSFLNRDEVTQDVEKITRSIELLQDMLAKKQINIDLKNLDLNPLYTDIPTPVSVQDLIRMSQHEENGTLNDGEQKPFNDDSQSTDVSSEGQIIPYTTPFSPSQYLDSDYVIKTPDQSRSDFFDNVLED